MDIAGLTAIGRTFAFQQRVNYLMVKASVAILNGTPDAADILLGQRILDGGESVQTWAIAVLGDSGIAAGAHTGDGDTITDGTLETTVNAVWSAFKK